jgi:hypothetical protein
MRSQFLAWKLALASATLVLASCGGGGGGGGDSGDGGGGGDNPGGGGSTGGTNDGGAAPAVSMVTLSGTVATGKPFAGAAVTVYNRTGAAVADPVVVGADGLYSVTVPQGTEAPLVLEAVLNGEALVSAAGATQTGTVNLTPLTSVIAARLAPDGNPRSLRANAAVATEANLSARSQEVLDAIATLRTALSDGADPRTGSFAADGTGHDRLLDNLRVSIRPHAAYSYLDLTVRSSNAGNFTTFKSSDTSIVPLLQAVNVANLAPVRVSAMVDDLLKRMTTCYAVPLEKRVATATAGTNSAVGGPADVIAPECRSLFLNDDPAEYLSSGVGVGRDAAGNGTFTGIFRRTATGVVFQDGRFEHLRGNGDIVFTAKNVSVANDEGFDPLVARNVNGVLKMVGNQYIYNANIRAFVEERNYLNQPAATWVGTGLSFVIRNALDTNGNSIFDRVEATSNGVALVLKPTGVRQNMTFMRSDGVTNSNSSLLHFNSAFRDPATPGSPATFESLFQSVPALTDDAIGKFSSQPVWTLRFVHVDTSKADVVQTHRLLQQGGTMAEAMARPLATLTADAASELRARTSATASLVFGPVSSTTPNRMLLRTASGGDYWQVPEGAFGPTGSQILGQGPDPDGAGPLARIRYDDSVTFGSSARFSEILCNAANSADNHCDATTGVNQFSQGASITQLLLFSGDRHTDLLSQYFFHRPIAP